MPIIGFLLASVSGFIFFAEMGIILVVLSGCFVMANLQVLAFFDMCFRFCPYLFFVDYWRCDFSIRRVKMMGVCQW